MKHIITISFIMILVLFGCSKDNPVDPVPAHVGTYKGTIDIGDSLSISVSNVGGVAYVTTYSLSYHYNTGGSSGSGTYEASNTEGIVQVTSSSFEISLSSDPEEKIIGTFSSDTELSGTYKIIPVADYMSGSFSAAKN